MSWLELNLKKMDEYLKRNVNTLWLETTGCCNIEVENLFHATYDIHRLGVNPLPHSPEEADLLLVAGWINKEKAEALKLVFSKMQDGAKVIAIGACTLSGSPFAKSNEELILASDILPIDVYVPGCPPRPEAIIDAIRLARNPQGNKVEARKLLYEAHGDAP